MTFREARDAAAVAMDRITVRCVTANVAFLEWTVSFEETARTRRGRRWLRRRGIDVKAAWNKEKPKR